MTSSTHLAKLVSNSAALSPDEKTVYINSNDHILHSYDVTSGIEKWSFDMTDHLGERRQQEAQT